MSTEVPRFYTDMRQPLKDRAILAVLQFLKDEGFTRAFDALELDTRKSYEDSPLAHASVLLSALTAHDESLAAERKEENDPKDLEEMLRHYAESAESSLELKSPRSVHAPHTMNIIAVKFHPQEESSLYATAAADKTVKISDTKTNAVVRSFDGILHAPGLYLDFNPKRPELLLVSCMNGTHFVLDHTREGSEAVVQEFKDHSKYVVACKWSPDGRSFATASWDNQLNVYDPVPESDGKEWRCALSVKYPAEVTAIEWIQPTGKLLVCVRDDNYVHEIDHKTLKETNKFNMNANTWDDHCSFAVLDLTASPDGAFVVAATDKDRLIVYHAASGKLMRNLYGANNGRYSNPRCCWSPCAKYVYASTEDREVAVWDVQTERLVAKVPVHAQPVRDMHRHPSSGALITCSFDKSVKTWTPPIDS